VTRSYRRGRRELAKVLTVADPHHVHSWRKRNKDIAYQLELLLPVLDRRAAKLHKRHAMLSRRLGEITDLFVLREFVARMPEKTLPQRAEMLRRLDKRARSKLQRVLDWGAKLFDARPRKKYCRLSMTADLAAR
jgi:CHAD domain-containing protein